MIIAPDGFQFLPPLVNPAAVADAVSPTRSIDTRSVKAVEATSPVSSPSGRPNLPQSWSSNPAAEHVHRYREFSTPPIVSGLYANTPASPDRSVMMLAGSGAHAVPPEKAVEAYERGISAPVHQLDFIA